ncbi:MAG TPA: ABC transporter ATP-binding protein [Drouetiella sp.]|jgi:ABC-2 type transport system ATP-binding protein
MENSPLIVVNTLIKSYSGARKRALNGISFEVSEGECFGLIGPNGAGKTTLMSCLLALVKPDAGTITIGGINPDDLSVREVIGFMPERPSFEGWLTPREFLKMHHMLAHQPLETAEEDIEKVLNRVGLEEHCWNRVIRTFSRGMLQRLGLAQALIGKPKILFLDEPGSGMDPPGNVLLRQLFGQFKEEKITVVLNSHHLDEMERVCDRVAFIRAGKIEAIETLEEVAQRPYVLFVKWLESPDVYETLKQCAERANAALISHSGLSAKFSVTNSEISAQLLRNLIMEGIRVQSAQPEQTTLERLFDDNAAAAPSQETLMQP